MNPDQHESQPDEGPPTVETTLEELEVQKKELEEEYQRLLIMPKREGKDQERFRELYDYLGKGKKRK